MRSRRSFIGIVLILLTLCSCNYRSSDNKIELQYSENIIFHLQYDHVHGPTIVELPDGDLLSAWFQGSGERWADDVKIMGSRLVKGDTSWSDTFLMADIPGFPDINPIMFMDTKDRLWLMWYPVLANQWETSIPMYRISEDYNNPGAPIWSWQDIIFAKPGGNTERGIQPADRFVEAVSQQLVEYEVYLKEELIQEIQEDKQDYLIMLWDKYKLKIDSLAKGENMIRRGRLLEGDTEIDVQIGYPLSRRIGWQTKNKPIIIGDRIIIPFYSDGFDCSLFAITDDLGKTWKFSNPVLGGIGIQPTIAITREGSLAAYLRDNGPPPKRMQRTNSDDGGMTWSIAKDVELPNPGAGFDMATLASGEWLIVYNHTEDGRHDLTVAISDNDGKSWNWKKKIEYDDRKEKATSSHYPAVIQGANGVIHTVYSYHHKDRDEGPGKTIKYASFPVSWVKE